MQVLKNSSIAVGIEWTLHDSVSEAKKAAAGKKKILAVRKVISGECVQGICAAPPKAGKLQAGALLVASVANDVLVYHSMGNGSVWVCAIREGIPLHGFDVVVDEKSAKETLAEVMSYVPSAEIYGDIAGAKGNLDNLFAQIAPKGRQAATLAAPDSPLLVLALVAMILLLAVLALFVYRYFETKTASNESSVTFMQSEEDLRRARMAFETDVNQARKIFWHARSPSRQFAIWYEVLRNLPVSANGWTPTAFNCDIAACHVVWKRDGRALPSSGADLPGSGADQSFNPALNERSTSFALARLEPVAHVEGGARTDKYLLDLSVSAALFKLVLTPSQTAVMVTPPAGTQGLAPVTIGVEGAWRASGSNPLLAPGFLGRLELPGVSLNHLSIKSLNLGRPQYTIELEGRYRVGH